MTLVLAFGLIVALFPQHACAEEKWVAAVRTSSEWSAFPCTDYWITVVCEIVKDFKDPGSLPPVVTVGDAIQYRDRNGRAHVFAVKAIKFYRFDDDLDFTSGGERHIAHKGDTQCFLYDSEKARRNEDYQSKLIVKGCELLQ
jgi:hypothetical protein